MDKPCKEGKGSKEKSGHRRYDHEYSVRGERLAHRIAWAEVNGPIPSGLQVRHICNNPGCVEITHLALGTQADNNKDRDNAERQARGESHARAILTGEEVLDIRRKFKFMTAKELGEEYGVSIQTIYSITSGRNWKHI